MFSVEQRARRRAIPGPPSRAPVAFAFAFGYVFTIVPMRRQGMAWRQAARLALAADTASWPCCPIVDSPPRLGGEASAWDWLPA
ncbi:DUF4396 domain-containing protein [Cupriavidus necator]